MVGALRQDQLPRPDASCQTIDAPEAVSMHQVAAGAARHRSGLGRFRRSRASWIHGLHQARSGAAWLPQRGQRPSARHSADLRLRHSLALIVASDWQSGHLRPGAFNTARQSQQSPACALDARVRFTATAVRALVRSLHGWHRWMPSTGGTLPQVMHKHADVRRAISAS